MLALLDALFLCPYLHRRHWRLTHRTARRGPVAGCLECARCGRRWLCEVLAR